MYGTRSAVDQILDAMFDFIVPRAWRHMRTFEGTAACDLPSHHIHTDMNSRFACHVLINRGRVFSPMTLLARGLGDTKTSLDQDSISSCGIGDSVDIASMLASLR